MAVKVLVTQLGQHIIADTKQVSRKETEEIIGQHPRRIPEDDDGKQFAARGFTKPGTIRGNFGADATSQVPSSGQEGVVVHR